MSEEGASKADMSSARACSPRKVRKEREGGGYQQKVRRRRRGRVGGRRVEGGLSEEVVSEE